MSKINKKNELLKLIEQSISKESKLKLASKKLRNDREIVLAAILKNPYEFKYASKELRNDLEIAYISTLLIAIEKDSFAFKFAPEKYKSDKNIILAAIQINSGIIAYVSN